MYMQQEERLSELLSAIGEKREDVRSLLFQWLITGPGAATDYTSIAQALLDAEERNLAHLVVSRALAEHPDNEHLALFAIGLKTRRSSEAAS